jgi:hypothetical protein
MILNCQLCFLVLGGILLQMAHPGSKPEDGIIPGAFTEPVQLIYTLGGKKVILILA